MAGLGRPMCKGNISNNTLFGRIPVEVGKAIRNCAENISQLIKDNFSRCVGDNNAFVVDFILWSNNSCLFASKFSSRLRFNLLRMHYQDCFVESVAMEMIHYFDHYWIMTLRKFRSWLACVVFLCEWYLLQLWY